MIPEYNGRIGAMAVHEDRRHALVGQPHGLVEAHHQRIHQAVDDRAQLVDGRVMVEGVTEPASGWINPEA